MRHETIQLKIVSAGATGVDAAGVCLVEDLVNKWVQVAGIAGGTTVQIEGTIDGTVFFDMLASAISADGCYELPQAVKRLRTNRKVTGSGTTTVTLGGHNVRTE